MSFENRRYLVIPESILEQVNFEQVLERDADSCRKSQDGTKVIIKYNVIVYEQDRTEITIEADTGLEHTTVIPAGTYGRPSVYSDEYPEYTHAEILEIVNGPDWTDPNPEMM